MNDEMSTTKKKEVIWEENASIEPKKKFESNGEFVECDITTNIKNSKNNVLLTDTIVTSGIYKIINNIDGKYYVGSTDNIPRRWYNHRFELRNNKHGNKYLQNAWNKYGESNFMFVIVETVSPDFLLSVEQTYLDKCKDNRDVSYNIASDAVSFMKGKHHTKESKCKIGSRNRGRLQSQSTRQKKSIAMRGRYDGNKNPSFGRIHTPEEKSKMLYGRMDKTIYTFHNTTTNETFRGMRYEFGLKHNMNIANTYNLIHGRSNLCKKWVLVSN